MSIVSLSSNVVKEKLGYLPAYYQPILNNSSLVAYLWQQYELCYLSNPLPSSFKEKLLIYLSKGCQFWDAVVCHSCQLYSMGVSGSEILSVLQLPYPHDLNELSFNRKYLAKIKANHPFLCEGAVFHQYLLPYCWLIFQFPSHEKVHEDLQNTLGEAIYGHLIAFLSYIRAYHQWLASYPQITYNQDYRCQLYLQSLLESEPLLRDYLPLRDKTSQSKLYQDKVNFPQNYPPKVTLTPKIVRITLPDAKREINPTIIYLKKTQGKQLKYVSETLFKRLYEQNKSLIQAHQDLEAFSSALCHDISAPLRAITGFSEVLGQKYCNSLDSKGQYYLQRIQINCQRMRELIEDLRRLSSITHQSLRKSLVNLSKLAQTVNNSLQEQFPLRCVRVKIEPNLQISGDYGLLKIALENLLGNAWKYTSKSPNAQINIGFCPQQKAFFIQDNGVGFNNDHAEGLFEAFQRFHSDKDFAGHGIGLATVSRIIKRHGGKIWAMGEVGKGATFYFNLS